VSSDLNRDWSSLRVANFWIGLGLRSWVPSFSAIG